MSVEEPNFDWEDAIDHLREDVECAKSSVKDKLKKRIKKLREKLAPNSLDKDRKQKCQKKLNQYLEQESALNDLDRDRILKFALRNKKTWQELESTSDLSSDRMLFNVATKDALKSAIEEFPKRRRKGLRRRLGMMNGQEAPDVKKLKCGHGTESDEFKTEMKDEELGNQETKTSDLNTLVCKSVLMVQRHRLCSEFMNLAENRGGLFTCGICSKVLVAETIQAAMMHAHSHSKMSLYGCKKCSWIGRTYDAVKMHLRRSHAAQMMLANYEDETDQCHTEIMGLIEKMFGKAK